MSEKYKISLFSAILISINIMLGTGIFINTVEVAKLAGSLGFVSYLIVGILMLPLIMSYAALMKLHPTGGFYGFARQEISPLFGFISTWSYFFAKMASAALMVHVSMSLVRQIIEPLQIIPTLLLDAIIFILFTALNMQGLRTGNSIQQGFVVLKIIPLAFAILSSIFLLSGGNFAPIVYGWEGIPSTLPLVLYVTLGFEAICALGHSIKDAHINAPRAIFISYGIVIGIVCLYQCMFYVVVGSELSEQSSYLFAFPVLLQKLFPGALALQHSLQGILHIAIACSALGGCYGIMFSNNWNLFSLAQHGHLFFSKQFATLNKNHVPYACIVAEGVLALVYLLITGGNQKPLQQLAGLGSVISYTLSIVALLCALKRLHTPIVSPWIPRLALMNCAILMLLCVRNFILNGLTPLVVFIGMLFFGLCMFLYNGTRQKYPNEF